MKTSSCKAKGRRAAAKVKEALLRTAPDLKENDIVVTSSGVTGPDLTLSTAALAKFPFVIEVKNQESIGIWAALKQSEGHAQGCETPLLCFTRNGAEMYACLKLDNLLKLLHPIVYGNVDVIDNDYFAKAARYWSPTSEVPFDWD